MRNFVKKLRAKLGADAQSPAWIFSVRGVGYRMPHPRDALVQGRALWAARERGRTEVRGGASVFCSAAMTC